MNKLKMDVALEVETREVVSILFNIFTGLPHSETGKTHFFNYAANCQESLGEARTEVQK